MIYVATGHWRSPAWIDIQLEYLSRTMSEPFKVYAWLDRIPDSFISRFDRTLFAKGVIAGKKNLVAAAIEHDADEQDLIMFMDGDAFPITDPIPSLREELERTGLVAIRRDENDEMQPHPAFCVTTVGFWSQMNAEWSAGYTHISHEGRDFTDTGANLLFRLVQSDIKWTPLLRSNRVNLHPLWFGIYGDLIYHHGVGFRRLRGVAVSRADRAESPFLRPSRTWPTRLIRKGLHLGWREMRGRSNTRLSDRIYAQIKSDPNFHKQFL